MAKLVYMALLFYVILVGPTAAQTTGTTSRGGGTNLANPYGAVSLPTTTATQTSSATTTGTAVTLYDRVLVRDDISERYPVEHIGDGRQHVIGARHSRRLVRDWNGSRLKCPGLGLVSAGGSYGPRTFCHRDASILRALAHSRYGRRNGRLRIVCCSGVSAW